MKIGLVVPGGVDRSGEHRVIPVLLALVRRLSAANDVHVFALAQEPTPGEWLLCGAHVNNIGTRLSLPRAVPAILRQHRAAPFDVLHSIWSGAPGMVTVAAARMLGVPSVVHVAGVELIALRDIACGGRLQWRGRAREALVLRAASAVTAASTPMVESLARLGHRAVRIPLGVDLHVWPPRAPRRRAGTGPARLVHVGSLNRIKDHSTLLRALARLAESGLDFRADIIGEDTLDGATQSLARDLGLGGHVRFRGFQTQRQLRPHIEAADLMLVSSRHEAGPVAMLEAAAVGVPTVGTAVGHVREWAPSAAVAVEVGDWKALAQSIRRLLEDEELRLRIAQRAMQRATAEDADCTAARFQQLYAQLLETR